MSGMPGPSPAWGRRCPPDVLDPAHTTDVVVMEVLAGARDDDHRDRLRRLLARCEHVPVQGLDDFEAAADLYRACRARGETVRSPADCLIAVVALRKSLPVLHADRDFDVLARHTALPVAARSDDKRSAAHP